MSKSFLNFLSKKIEYLKLDKKSSKLKDFSSKAENIFDTNGGLTAQQLKETIDYDKLAEELTNSNGNSLASDLSVNVGSIFGEFVNLVGKDSIDGVLDDGYKDGIITGDELEKYMETLMGDDNTLTLSDFDEAIDSANIDLEEEMNSILKEAEDSKTKDAASKAASGGGGGGGSIGSSKNKNPLDTSKKETSNKDPKDMSLDELKSEQSQEAANLGTYKDEMNNAISAREENQAKQEEYINQLKSTQDETASQLADTIQNISDYETNIFQAQEGINISNARITTLKGEITSLNTTIGNLNGQISALESQTTEDGQKVDNNAEIAQLKGQIQQAEQSIKEKEDEISTEESNIAQYNTTIQTNQGLYDGANEQKVQLEEKLSSDIKDKISQAKTDYEAEQQTNNKAIAKAQSSFEKSQARLNDIERYIALKDKPADISEEGNEYLDKINNPDTKNTKLDEEHYEELFDEISNNQNLSVSEKMYLMSQMKSAVNTDKSLSALEDKFKQFTQQDEVQQEISNDKTGRLGYQAAFVEENSGETLGNLNKFGNMNTISHRGYNAKDNSIEGIENAIEAGYDTVEIDVRMKDGEALLSHDAISGDGSNLASLEDALTTVAESQSNTNMYIELKDDMSAEDVQKVVKMVEDKGLEGQVTWISFNADNLKTISEYNSSARLGYLSDGTISEDTIKTLQSLQTEDNEVFLDAKASTLTDSILQSLQDGGYNFEAWGVDDEATCEKLARYGCSGITTDKLKDEVVEEIVGRVKEEMEAQASQPASREPLIVDGMRYQEGEVEYGSEDGIYQYKILVPEGVDPNADLPVMFYMTGRGANENGIAGQEGTLYGQLFAQGHGFNGFNGIVVIPLSAGKSTEITDSHINDINGICDEIKQQYPNADTRNMGLVGFSDGATRAYQVANADKLNNGNHHFDSVLMIDRAEEYSSEDDEAFKKNNIHLGVYYSYVYGAECQEIQAAEFNELIANDHTGALRKSCSQDTIKWLYRNRI